MKKFITLLLVLTGMVSTASAADVTRRIVVENQMGPVNSNWATDNLYILAYYKNSNNEDVDLKSWGSAMYHQGNYTIDNGTKTRRVFYCDITADESIFEGTIYLQFYFGNSATQNDYDRAYWNGTYSNDLVFYVYPGSDNKTNVSTETLVYYLIKSATNDYSKLADLSYSNGVATGTYTNSTTTYAIVAPNYALWDNFGGIRDWSLVYRASDGTNDYDINSFQVYTPTIDATDKVFKFSLTEKYDLSFDIINRTSTITPYRTATFGTTAGYMTYSTGEKCTVSGADAIYVIDVNNTNTVHMKEMGENTVWPANEGMILKGDKDDEVTIKAVSSDATPTTIGTNYLVGSGNSTTSITAASGIYIFNWDGSDPSTVGFYLANSGTLGAHKAYLNLNRSSFNAREFLAFDFGNEETGINAMTGKNVVDGITYSLSGQRVAKPTKGLYIVNGKKLIKN